MSKFKKPLHIHAKPGDIADIVIASGDPGRVRLLAKLLKDPVTVNEYRGFLTYTGYYNDKRVTLATHGVGGASSAIVFEELIMLGAKKIVRLGTTGGLREDLEIGDVIVVEGAVYSVGGTIGMYVGSDIGYATTPDIELTHALYSELKKRISRVFKGIVFSSDAFYAENESFVERCRKLNIISVEMECATLSVIGRLRNIKTACVLIVSDNLIKRITVLDALDKLSERVLDVGRAILDILSSLRDEGENES
ncbi:MAG: purine-nucleoside phosphorylase [Sulfolobales archaeon]